MKNKEKVKKEELEPLTVALYSAGLIMFIATMISLGLGLLIGLLLR